jgi:hypothetical protein
VRSEKSEGTSKRALPPAADRLYRICAEGLLWAPDVPGLKLRLVGCSECCTV